jgi:branched-chain amino acid transport system permease protein
VKRYLVVAPAVAFMAAFPVLFQGSYLVGIMILVGIYAIVAFSLDLIIGYSGQLVLGHQGFFGLGAYVSGVLATRYGLSPLLSMLNAILFTCVAAYVIGRPAFRLRGYYLGILTLAFGLIIHSVFVSFRGFTGGTDGLRQIPPFSVGPLVFDTDFKYYYLVWVLVLLSLILYLNIVNSRMGLALRAIKEDEYAAAAMAINVPRYKMMVFLLTAGFAALAGALYAHYMKFISPDSFDLHVLFLITLMAFLGGKETIWGSLIGAAILKFLPSFVGFLQDYKVLFYGLVFTLILKFFPNGIAGLLKEKLNKAMRA